jgi:hypothetical protein
MTRYFFYLFLILLINPAFARHSHRPLKIFKANNPNIQYFARVDFSDPLKPRFWPPGVYVKAKFKGTSCELIINDEVMGGDTHNYIEIAVDDQPPFRVQTTDKINIIKAAMFPKKDFN